MRALSIRGPLLLAAELFVLFAPATVRAQQAPPPAEDTTKAACLRTYETSQVHRRNQELRAARQDLLVCAQDACPGIARSDCVQWLAEVEAALPTVVFEARDADGAVFDVTVKVDGAPLTIQLDGRAVEVDPGIHTFTFERIGKPSIEQRVIVRAGEKSRSVVADWSPKPVATSNEKVPTERPVPASVFYVGGIGAGAGLIAFGVAGIWGDIKKGQVESTDCAPFCSSSEVHTVRTLYAVADVGLGVAVVSVIASGILYFARPERPIRAPAAAASFFVDPAASGATAGWRGSF